MSISKKRAVIALLAISSLIFTAACGDGGAARPNTGNNQDGSVNAVSEAPAAYRNSCIGCHAADLRGNVGPNSNLQKVGSRLSRDEIADIIANGKPNTRMPAFNKQLSEEEIQELADWLAEMK